MTDEDTRLFIQARRQQIVALLDPDTTNEYKRQTAARIEARIARLESGEEALPKLAAVQPKRKRKASKRRGNPDKVDGVAAYKALHMDDGDRQVAWSRYVQLKNLSPGCDAKDFYAWCDGEQP